MALLTNINGKFSVDTDGAASFNRIGASTTTGFTFPSADGANGEVLKTNGSGTVSWSPDSSPTVYWAANGNDIYNTNSANVGIGETSPATKLDIGGMADPVVRIKSAAGGDPQLRFDASQANRSALIKFYDNGSSVGGFISYLHNGDKMNFGSGSSTGITMTVGDGKVGIGTDSPGYKLSVANASTRIISATYIDGANGIMSHAGAPNYGLESFQVRGDFISFWTDYDASHYQGTEKMRIDQSGNVLIGTTSIENPRGLAQALEIEAGSPVGIILNDSRDTYPMGIENAGAVMNFTYNTSPLMTILAGGNVGIGTTVVTDPGFWFDTTNNYLSINKWTVSTATPAAMLHLFGRDNDIDVPAIIIEGRDNPGDTRLKIAVKDPQVRFLLDEGSDAAAGYGLMTFETTAQPNASYSERGGFDFDLPGGTAMTILNTGNVGIGTEAPSTPLMVNRASNSNEPGIYYDVTGGSSGSVGIGSTAAIGPFIVGNTLPDGNVRGAYSASRMLFNGGGFAFQTSDETSGTRTFDDKVKILINGNVGIGTTGPTAKLQIGLNPDPSQTAESLVHLLSSTAPTTANGFNILKLDYLAGNVAGDAGATIIFNQGYHSGNIDYTAPVGALRGYRTGPNYSYGGGLQLLYQPDAGALGLLVGMTLTGSGYVGIGLTAPSARLNTGVNVEGSFLPYLNGTGTSFTTATNIITVHDSSALGTNTTAGLMLINNNNSNDAPSPLIAFSARSTSNTYNHTYAAIWGEKDSTGADTNWNTGSIIFATSTSTGPYERMRINPVGNVTIGTTNNAALLNVGGPILASDNGQTAGMYVTRNLTISHPGSSGTFTRTFNPVTQFGISRTGGAVKIMASGWQGKLQAGYIVWRNAGGGGNITAVYYYPSASSGLGETITVGVNAANNNTIDVTFTGWHSNSHGWYTKISATQ